MAAGIPHICENLSNAYFEQTWTTCGRSPRRAATAISIPPELAHGFNAMINGLWIDT